MTEQLRVHPGIEGVPGSTAGRTLALAGLAGALIQVFGGILEIIDRAEAGSSTARVVLMTAAYLLLAAGMAGLAWSGVCGVGRLGQGGPFVASAGFLLEAVADVVLLSDVDLAEQVLFPIGMALVGLGLLAGGIGALGARALVMPDRVVPLVCGLYPFVVVFPSFAVAGEPVFAVLAVWGLCLAILGVTVLRASRR